MSNSNSESGQSGISISDSDDVEVKVDLESKAIIASLTKTEHETHCDSCINLKQCLKEQKVLLRKQGKDETSHNFRIEDPRLALIAPGAQGVIISCPIVSCPFGCLHRFHGCKREEHELLCSRKRVPCVNVHYGCPFVMERRLRSAHLRRCPARCV